MFGGNHASPGRMIGRVYEDADLGTPPELRWFWSVTAIRASNAQRDERPRHYARRGDGEVSRRMGEGQDMAVNAQFEISIDGVPRMYRDDKAMAIETAENLKRKHPHSAVTVENMQTGETTAIEYKPDLGLR